MPAGGLLTAGVIAGGLGLASGAAGYFQGQNNVNAAKAAANANVRPVYTIPQSEQDMLSLAESRAGQGLDESTKQQLLNNTSGSQAASLNTILKGGGDINTVGNLAENTQSGLNNIALADNNARLQSLQNLQNAKARWTADQDKAWQINSEQPFKDKAAAAAAQLAAGTNQENSSLNSMTSSLMGLSGSMGGGTSDNIGKTPTTNLLDSGGSGGLTPDALGMALARHGTMGGNSQGASPSPYIGAGGNAGTFGNAGGNFQGPSFDWGDFSSKNYDGFAE